MTGGWCHRMAIVSPWRQHLAKSIPDAKSLLFLVDFAAVLAVCSDLLALFLLLLLILKQPSQLGQKAVRRHDHPSGLLVLDAPQKLCSIGITVVSGGFEIVQTFFRIRPGSGAKVVDFPQLILRIGIAILCCRKRQN